ncbi:MAG: EpsI family protein [Burkholderiales bacterium]|nr:EpsI family protein [Burkholderiales bacterium]
MKGVRVKAVVLAGLMALGAVAAEVTRPTTKIADRGEPVQLERLFPREFGPWRVDDSLPVILPAPDVQAKLDKIYNQVLSRTYVDAAGRRIMLSVAYGGDQSDGTNAHKPEVCYPAQGFQLGSSRRGAIDMADGTRLAVRDLTTQLGTRHEPITYWIVVGDSTVTTGTEQKLIQLKYGLRGLIPDGMLVRISSIDADAAKAHALHRAFVADLAAALDAEARRRVFGAGATAGAASVSGPGA